MRSLKHQTSGFFTGQVHYDGPGLSELLYAWSQAGLARKRRDDQATATLFMLAVLLSDLHVILSPAVWVVQTAPLVMARMVEDLEKINPLEWWGIMWFKVSWGY